MAKNDTKSAASTSTTQKPSEADAPSNMSQEEIDEFASEGFKKVSTSVLYFKPSPGATIVGIPLLRAERETNIDPTKKGFFYLLVATKPGKAASPGGEMSDYEPGAVIHVDERWACQALKNLLPHVKENPRTGEEVRSRYCEVKIVAKKQVPTSKPGQKVWLMDIGQKPADKKTLAIASGVDHVALLGYTPPEVDDDGNIVTKALPETTATAN